ncbi:hypothetical protein AAMO2058_001094900 [Amorphochlora amoebiformis]
MKRFAGRSLDGGLYHRIVMALILPVVVALIGSFIDMLFKDVLTGWVLFSIISYFITLTSALTLNESYAIKTLLYGAAGSFIGYLSYKLTTISRGNQIRGLGLKGEFKIALAASLFPPYLYTQICIWFTDFVIGHVEGRKLAHENELALGALGFGVPSSITTCVLILHSYNSVLKDKKK